MAERYDLAIVGGGLAGTLAAALAAHRFPDARIALLAPTPATPDPRTTAMLVPAIADLDALGVWEELRPACAPLRRMRIVDGSRRLFRARTIAFDSSEIGFEAFGWNVPNALATEALGRLCADRMDRIDVVVADVTMGDDKGVVLHGADGRSFTARYVLAADGRSSVVRQGAGIGVRRWHYPQRALVTTFAHTLSHDDTSTEFHTDHGPCTQVPLPGRDGASHRSSLVWMMPPAHAQTLAELAPEALSERIAERLAYLVGRVTVDGPVQTFPMEGLTANELGRGRVLLIGEAAHVFPPIGAQGFNLAHRDVLDALAAIAAGGDVAARYERSRRADVQLRTLGVDLLNRSVLQGYVPLQLGRVAGLSLLDRFEPLRRFAMLAGLAPGMAAGVSPETDRMAANPT